MKVLDFVKTQDGKLAMITEKNLAHNGLPDQFSLAFIGGGGQAWYQEQQLIYVDNLPRLLANNMYHPFGEGRKAVEKDFPI